MLMIPIYVISKSNCMIACTYQTRSHLNSDFMDLCINGDLLQNVSCQNTGCLY